jgi:hypothetical protein
MVYVDAVKYLAKTCRVSMHVGDTRNLYINSMYCVAIKSIFLIVLSAWLLVQVPVCTGM